jgi:hypothetical protein
LEKVFLVGGLYQCESLMVRTEDFVVCGLLLSRGSGRYGGGFKMGVWFFGHWIASSPILSGQAVPPSADSRTRAMTEGEGVFWCGGCNSAKV